MNDEKFYRHDLYEMVNGHGNPAYEIILSCKRKKERDTHFLFIGDILDLRTNLIQRIKEVDALGVYTLSYLDGEAKINIKPIEQTPECQQHGFRSAYIAFLFIKQYLEITKADIPTKTFKVENNTNWEMVNEAAGCSDKESKNKSAEEILEPILKEFKENHKFTPLSEMFKNWADSVRELQKEEKKKSPSYVIAIKLFNRLTGGEYKASYYIGVQASNSEIVSYLLSVQSITRTGMQEFHATAPTFEFVLSIMDPRSNIFADVDEIKFTDLKTFTEVINSLIFAKDEIEANAILITLERGKTIFKAK